MNDSSVKSIRSSLSSFDGKAAAIILPILGAAVLWWLGHYFVTKEQYQTDQNRMEKKIDDTGGDVRDIKNFLMQRRDLHAPPK